MAPDNHVIHAAHEAPTWVKVSPFIAMLIGFVLAWLFYIKRPEPAGRLAAQQRPLYLFLLNKWYFDELYDVIFVRPAKWLAASCGRRATAMSSTARSTAWRWGSSPSSPASPAARSRATSSTTPSRWCWGSCPCHLDDALGAPRGAQKWKTFSRSSPSCRWSRRLILALFLRGDDAAARRGAKRLALFTTTATFLISLFLLAGFDPGEHRLPVRRGTGLDHGPDLQDGRRRHLDPVRDADHLPDADHHLCRAGAWTTRVKEYMIAFLVLETLMLGVFTALDLVLFYLFFEAGPDPDVPDHRHLGRQGPHLRGVQVLPLHLPRLGPDAGRDDRDVSGRGHHRHRQR
jgi:hypothetical protein